MPDDTTKEGLADILQTLKSLGQEKDEVTVGDIRDAFGHRSFGPFLLIPAVIEISPIGGIPGLPTVLALVIALFAVQILIGRKDLWLPGFIDRRHFKGKKLAKAMDKMGGVARVTDKVLRSRLDFAVHRPFVLIIALLTIALCVTVPFLEIVPFASTVPMGAIALFGLGLTARDGLVVILAAILAVIAFYVAYVALL